MGQDQSCCGGDASEREQSRKNEEFETAIKPHKQSAHVEPGPDSGTKADLEATLPAAALEKDENRRPSEQSEARASTSSVRFVVENGAADTSATGPDSPAHNDLDRAKSNATNKSEATVRAMNTTEAFSSFAPGLAAEEHRDAREEQENRNGDESEQRTVAALSSMQAQDGAGASEEQERRTTLAAELEESHYNATHIGSAKVGANASGTHADTASESIDSTANHADADPRVKADTSDADNTDAADTPKNKKCCVVM